MSLGMRRTSSGRSMPSSYWMPSDIGPLDRADPISVNSHLMRLQDSATAGGFTSLLEAAALLVQSTSDVFRATTAAFVSSEAFPLFLAGCAPSLQTPVSASGSAIPDAETPKEDRVQITAVARKLYGGEWKQLISDKAFKKSMNEFDADYLNAFSFESLFTRMSELAPGLTRLMLDMTERTPRSEAEGTVISTESHRHIVAALSLLARQQNRLFSGIQAMMGYVLFAHRTPKRVIELLNHMGLTVGYESIRRGLRSNANHFRRRLKAAAASGNAIIPVLDNIQFQAKIRDQRVTNHGSFIIGTAGLLIVPPASRSQPMFTHADCDYSKVDRLTALDFMPSMEDEDILKRGFGNLIAEIIRGASRAYGTTPPKMDFPMPVVHQIDRHSPPEILPFGTFNLNEGKLDELIKVLYGVQDQMGLSAQQATDNVIETHGDLLTTLQMRRARNRQSECTPHMQLKWVDTASGLFHLQYNVLLLLFRNHRGRESDTCSLSRWISALGRLQEKIWDGSKNHVKDFRTCNDFFHTVVSGYVLSAVVDMCGYRNLESFLKEILKHPKRLQQVVLEFTDRLFDYDAVSESLGASSETRDRPHENWIMMMQHGLMYRFLERSMSQGDSGRVMTCLKYITIWLQGTEQTLYAAEMLHLTACMKHCWSEAKKSFYLNNCMVSLSGKKEGFVATDALCEHLIGEIKSMVPSNVTETTLQYLFDVVSRQIFYLKDIRAKVASETQAPTPHKHHKSVNQYTDLKTVCNELLRARIGEHVDGRGPKETARADLHHQGQTVFGYGNTIERYKNAAKVKRGLPIDGLEEILASEQLVIDNAIPNEDMYDDDAGSWV